MSKEDYDEFQNNLLRAAMWLTWVDEHPEDAWLIGLLLKKKCDKSEDVNKEMREM